MLSYSPTLCGECLPALSYQKGWQEHLEAVWSSGNSAEKWVGRADALEQSYCQAWRALMPCTEDYFPVNAEGSLQPLLTKKPHWEIQSSQEQSLTSLPRQESRDNSPIHRGFSPIDQYWQEHL